MAKTIQYGYERPPEAFDALIDGYGPLGENGPERIRLYRIYHALELWDWFATIGTSTPLDGIAMAMRSLLAADDR